MWALCSQPTIQGEIMLRKGSLSTVATSPRVRSWVACPLWDCPTCYRATTFALHSDAFLTRHVDPYSSKGRSFIIERYLSFSLPAQPSFRTKLKSTTRRQDSKLLNNLANKSTHNPKRFKCVREALEVYSGKEWPTLPSALTTSSVF